MSNLENKFTLSIYYNDTGSSTTENTYWRYQTKNGSYIFGKFGYQGRVTSSKLDNISNFREDFTITYGTVTEQTKIYCQYLTNISKEDCHPLQFESIEKYTDGCLVDIDGYRVSLKPIEHSINKVANTLDSSSGRLKINILSENIKNKYFHSQDWKDNSKFKSYGQRGNPLTFAIEAMYGIQKKAFKDSKANRTEDLFIKVLDSKEIDKKATSKGSIKGKQQETNIQTSIKNYDDFASANIIIGDMNVKKDIFKLKSGTEGYQGIDILLQFDDEKIWIALQIKTGERETYEKVLPFVNTFEELRRIGSEKGCKCFALLVHTEGLKSKDISQKLSTQIGFTIISKDGRESPINFEKKVNDTINFIRKYYSINLI